MDNPPENQQLENYLDRVCVWLVLIPEADRDELRLELRQHLQAIATAEVTRGATQGKAISDAIERMGNADAVGNRLKQAWQDKMERQRKQLIPAGVKRLLSAHLFVITLLFASLLPIWMWLNTPLPGKHWPLAIAGSTLAGTGLGLLQRRFEGKLSLLLPPPSRQKAQKLALIDFALLALPKDTFRSGRNEYHRSQGAIKWGKKYFLRIAENPDSRYQLFESIPIPLSVAAITALLILAQDQSHNHPLFIISRQIAELLTVFTAKDIVTAASGNFVKSQA